MEFYRTRAIQITDAAVRVRRDSDGPVLEGYAAVFDSEAYNELVRPGAFKKTLKENKNIRALWNHESSRPLATTANKTLSLSEDDHGLRFEMRPDVQTQDGKDTVRRIETGLVTGMSFGFEVIKEKMTKRDDENKQPLFELLEVKLHEVSPVTFPWYEDTEVEVKDAMAIMAASGKDVRAFQMASRIMSPVHYQITAERDVHIHSHTAEPGTNVPHSDAGQDTDNDADAALERKVRQRRLRADAMRRRQQLRLRLQEVNS